MSNPDRYLKMLLAAWIGATATLAWLSYGDAARRTIATSYPQLGWLAPRPASIARGAPDTTGLAGQAVPSPDQQRLNAMSHDLEATRQSVDRVAVTQERIMRNVDKLTVAQEQMTRNVDQLTARQGQMMDGIAKLQAAEQPILHKNPEPASRPAPVARNSVRR
jgi:hypothetical protein